MIQLPEIFERDIQGKTTHLVPLVVINNSTFLSTNKLTLDNQHYDPLVRKLGNIKESIDFKDKKFKISSVSIDCFNYNYNNEYLSNRLFGGEIMNKQIDIYYKSQSAQTLDDCLNVFSGYIKGIEENIDTITIDIEDNSEQTLSKKLPLEYVPENKNIPNRYNNVRIPFVYGIVDKAPCVYYDIYGTSSQIGSKYYLVTPDKFFLRKVESPFVFSDEVYGQIADFPVVFFNNKQDTIYEDADDNQFNVIGNTIYFVKETIKTNNSTFSTTPIGYNFVEILVDSPVTFNNSTYTLRFQKEGENEKVATTNILAFADPDGMMAYSEDVLSAQHDMSNPVFLMVKDFSSLEGNLDMPYNNWFWGENKAYDTDYVKLEGESVINLEAGKFFNSSNIVKQFELKTPTENLESKDVNYNVTPIRIVTAKVQEVETGTGGDSHIMPKINFQWVDNAVEFFYMYKNIQDAENIDDEYVLQSASEQNTDLLFGYGLPTKNISHNKAILGQREYDSINGEFNLMNQSGIVKWLKLSSMYLRRRAILSDFLDYDLYAYTEGRVDTVDGRYTASPQLQYELRVGTIEEGAFEERGTAPIKQPIRKPIKQPVRKPVGKPVAKTKLKKIKKGKY